MTARRFISRFTPSRSEPEDLEKILVQRHALLDETLDRVAESARSAHKHHMLFVGPRGTGKTHFVTLLVHRLEARTDLVDRLRIAWLNEDETCTHLLDLLLRIYRALEKKYPAEFPSDVRESLYDLSEKAASQRAADELLARIEDRCLMVVVENLDLLFESMGDKGQKELRALLQNRPVWSIVATTQGLRKSITSRSAPFFGFFQIEHMHALSVDEAAELLANIANLQGDVELRAFLRTPRGRSRVEALHHLSGGNHRLYVILSEFISRDSLDNLVRPFEEMVDDLTPYYQERLRCLTPQQRKIVEFLCTCERPTAVKDIARGIFASQQTVASQLKTLRELRYVEAHSRGRESLYELTEPLMRLCVEAKENQQREPLRLIVDFLRVWYDENDLDAHLQEYEDGASEKLYIARALEQMREQAHLAVRPQVEMASDRDSNPRACGETASVERSRRLNQLLQAQDEEFDWGAIQNFIGEDERLYSEAALQLFRRATALLSEERWGETLRIYEYVLSIAAADTLDWFMALCGRGVCCHLLGRVEEGLSDLSAAAEMRGLPPAGLAFALTHRGVFRAISHDLDGADLDFSGALEAVPASFVVTRGRLLAFRGMSRSSGKRWDEALDDFSASIDLLGKPEVASVIDPDASHEWAFCHPSVSPGTTKELWAQALISKAELLRGREDHEGALRDLSCVIEGVSVPDAFKGKALLQRADVWKDLGKAEQQQADLAQLLALPGVPFEQIVSARLAQAEAADGVDAEQLHEQLGELLAHPEMTGSLRFDVLLQRGKYWSEKGRFEEAHTDFTRALELPELAPAKRVFALLRRGIMREAMDDVDGALEDYSAVIVSESRVEGTLRTALQFRGALCIERGQYRAGMNDLEQAFEVARATDQFLFPNTVTRLITAALKSGLGAEAWGGRALEFVELFERHGFLSELGAGLVRSVRGLLDVGLDPSGLDAWRKVWAGLAAGRESLVVPLRIFTTGVDYAKSRDPGTLLQLAREERELLTRALGLSS